MLKLSYQFIFWLCPVVCMDWNAFHLFFGELVATHMKSALQYQSGGWIPHGKQSKAFKYLQYSLWNSSSRCVSSWFDLLPVLSTPWKSLKLFDAHLILVKGEELSFLHVTLCAAFFCYCCLFFNLTPDRTLSNFAMSSWAACWSSACPPAQRPAAHRLTFRMFSSHLGHFPKQTLSRSTLS